MAVPVAAMFGEPGGRDRADEVATRGEVEMVGGGVQLAGSASASRVCKARRGCSVPTSFWAVNESVGRVAMSGCRCHDVWRSGAGIGPPRGGLVHIQAQMGVAEGVWNMAAGVFLSTQRL